MIQAWPWCDILAVRVPVMDMFHTVVVRVARIVQHADSRGSPKPQNEHQRQQESIVVVRLNLGQKITKRQRQ